MVQISRRNTKVVTKMWRDQQLPRSQKAAPWGWHRPAGRDTLRHSNGSVNVMCFPGLVIFVSINFFCQYLPDEGPPDGLVVPRELSLHLLVAWRKRKEADWFFSNDAAELFRQTKGHCDWYKHDFDCKCVKIALFNTNMWCQVTTCNLE